MSFYQMFIRSVLLLVLSCCVTAAQAGSSLSPGVYTANTQQTATLLFTIRSWAEKLSPFKHGENDDFQWVETTHVEYDLREQHQPVINTGGIEEFYGLEHTVSPGGMFHRMGSGFHHGLGNTAPALPYTRQDDNNLVLNVGLPADLSLNSSDVIWHIKSQGSQKLYQLHGQNQSLALPVGAYDVTLNIGHYQENQLIKVIPGRIAKAEFSGNVGRLQAYSEKLANWEVVNVQKNGRPVHIRSQGMSRQFDAIVAADEYDLTAIQGATRQNIRVRVGRGQTQVATIRIPGGRVNLVATLNNAPALRPMEWKVFRLDEGRKEIAAPGRHSATLVIPAGHYEAVATLNGRQRSRQFTVSNGADSNVILAMD